VTTPTFTVHTLDRDVTWRVSCVNEDGSTVDAATVRWLVELGHPNLARARFEDGLNHPSPVPYRTWGWQPVKGTYRAELLHNGSAVAEIDWSPHIRGKAALTTGIVDACNQPRGAADPFPEPKPPASRWALVRGDHDHSTGKDVAA